MNEPTPPLRTVTFEIEVQFGDCDPARIVWFPNYFRWIDAASRHYFVARGVPRWEETERTLGIIGTPIVDTKARFLRTASYGDKLSIDTQIAEWRAKSFVQRHVVRRCETTIAECEEVRIFAVRRDDDRNAIRAVPAPVEIRLLCE